jgi:hypothetical protein
MGTRWASRLAGHAAGNTFFLVSEIKNKERRRKTKTKSKHPSQLFFLFVCAPSFFLSFFLAGMSDGADHSFLFFVSFHLTCKPPLKKREKNSRSFQLGVYVRFDALFFFLFHMCRCFPSLFMFLSFSSYALFFPFFFCECRSAVFRWLGKWRGERPFASVFFF